ncbi:hypothetical protein V5799_009252 [Amblyomma americanum]|uniref:Uncharacterized protein n=1 Tax=Amblyomma americanum TaxID=6943 RepID=A0AAQ4FCA1_AMBAM
MAFVTCLPLKDEVHRHTGHSTTKRLPCAGSQGQSVPAPLKCQRCLERTTSKTSTNQTRKARSKGERDERIRRSNDSFRSKTSRHNTPLSSKSSLAEKRKPQKRADKSCKRSCEALSPQPAKTSPSAASRTSNASSSKTTSRATAAQSSAARSLARSSKESAASPVMPSGQRHATRRDEAAQGRSLSNSRQQVPNGGQAHGASSTSRGQKRLHAGFSFRSCRSYFNCSVIHLAVTQLSDSVGYTTLPAQRAPRVPAATLRARGAWALNGGTGSSPVGH